MCIKFVNQTRGLNEKCHMFPESRNLGRNDACYKTAPCAHPHTLSYPTKAILQTAISTNPNLQNYVGYAHLPIVFNVFFQLIFRQPVRFNFLNYLQNNMLLIFLSFSKISSYLIIKFVSLY